MQPIKRRTFLKSSIAAGLSLGLPIPLSAEPGDAIRLAVVGLGDTKAVGGVGGRGHQLIGSLRKVSGARIVALCDVDPAFVERELQPFKARGEEVTTHNDLRRVFDDKSIDAVVIALPNHWHALATVWACQAGKDVYVEKPLCHDLWEGQQMVAAARRYNRMIQVGTQNRSSTLLHQTFEYLRGGELGPIRYAHALVYRGRDGIGRVDAPTPVPATVNYDLWCGPAPKGPLLRRQLNYEWHWFWDTGNGEMGNNGIHVIDICRWALGQNQSPPRAMSIGGRFAFNDCGQTANTQIALLDYQPAPIICEIRNVSVAKVPNALGKFRNQDHGVVIDCAGGYFSGDASGGALFDNQGKKIKDLKDGEEFGGVEVSHLSNFVAAVRSRKVGDLAAEALEGHLSAACCHMANVSHRLGKQLLPEAIGDAIKASPELSDAFERCSRYLRENSVDLTATPATSGPWVTFDPVQQHFVKEFEQAANELSRRHYREPFVVPQLT